jgi:hypothetical protein
MVFETIAFADFANPARARQTLPDALGESMVAKDQ